MSPRRNAAKRTPHKSAVSKRLEMLRNHLGLDTNTMAAKMKVAVSTYRTYKKGDYTPSPESLATLSNTTNVSLDWLLAGKGGMFFRDADRALEAEKQAVEKQKQTDTFERELEEMNQVMRRIPKVRYRMMAYYQEVIEDQKVIMHRQPATPRIGYEEPQPPAPVVPREPEPPAAIPKEPEVPAVISQEPEAPAVIYKEPQAPPPVVRQEPEAPAPDVPGKSENRDKKAPGVKMLFPKKRKAKRKKK
ncbi:MAG: helix-turn-helix domain-containing protein [bacterium]|nr:helix-turn-helix domain-containing protein [bacterium]